jgi:hypothetical protein
MASVSLGVKPKLSALASSESMRLLKFVTSVSLMFCARIAVAQVQTPLHVGAFGGVREPLQPIQVPPELKSFVPKGLTLRAVLKTSMFPEGETLLLYDNGEESFPEVHLHALRRGRDVKLFDGVIAGVAGLLPIQTQKGQQIVSFAYHVGFDEADTTFMILASVGDSYRVIFERKTTTGQMRILSESPVKFELWSADWKLDQGESCVWCPHRYRVRTYLLQGDKFLLTARRLTKAPLDPANLAERTFVAGSGKE